jgi:hypothetical protein
VGTGARVHDRHSPAQRFASQLRGQTRLSDAARARHEHHAAAPLARLGQQLDQVAQLAVPARQDRGARIECRRQLLRAGRRIKRRVLREDRGLQRPQLRARLDADRLDECAARRAVGLKCLRLPTAPVQGQHQLRVHVLTKRLVRRHRLKLAN